jgi:hypothetical protein
VLPFIVKSIERAQFSDSKAMLSFEDTFDTLKSNDLKIMDCPFASSSDWIARVSFAGNWP